MLVITFWWLVWTSIPRDTDKRRVHVSAPRRLARWYRMWLARLVLFPIGWPHLVDLAFGAARTGPGTPGDVVWSEGRATVTRFRGSPQHREPVLVVHSLVTKPWILDLTPSRSFVGMLVAAGFNVYLLDWGDPGADEATNGLDEYGRLLRRAEAAVLAESGSHRLHEIGYCLAGTLLLHARASDNAECVASMALIATPVDFAVPGSFERVMRHPALRPVLALDGSGGVPGPVVREAFHALRPQALQSIRLRVARRRDPEYREFYAAMARWAWSHRRFPGALFFDFVDLHRNNPFVPKTGPSPIAKINAPMFVAIAERDHIVPSGSSHALSTLSGLDVQVVNLASGHVSMIVGRAAKATLWPALVAFLRDQQR